MSALGSPDVVLVVDADPKIGALFRRAADALKLEIVVASDARAAWRVIVARRPVAVFTDYLLVGMDGLSLLEKVRTQLPGAQRVLHTAERISRPVTGMDVPVLAKPCEEGALRELLSALVPDDVPRAAG